MRICAWIVDAVLVPGLNFIRDERRLSQRDPVDQAINLFAGRRVFHDGIRDSADNFVTILPIAERGGAEGDPGERNQDLSTGKHCESLRIRTSVTDPVNDIASKTRRRRFRRSRAELHALETKIRGREAGKTESR